MSRSTDPSYDRLVKYLDGYFPELKSYERGQAIYWFAVHYHSKPGSNLHDALQRFAFSGVPALPPPERGDAAWAPYQMLSVTYAPFGRPRDPNKADKHERQHVPKPIKPKAKRARKAKPKAFDPRHLPMPTLLGLDWFMHYYTLGWIEIEATTLHEYLKGADR